MMYVHGYITLYMYDIHICSMPTKKQVLYNLFSRNALVFVLIRTSFWFSDVRPKLDVRP